MSAQGERLGKRLRAGEILAGTWVKTPSPTVVEVLAATGLDLLCLDAEHAPFDRAALDLCCLAARAGGMDCLIRVPSTAEILNALDLGADGVVVPHVATAEDAGEATRASRYGRGGRGYAGSSRAAGYGTRSMAAHLDGSRQVVVVAQIEDAEALDAIDAIAGTEGLDALFIGRADLAVSLGETSAEAPLVIAAAERIARAARAAGKPCGMFVGNLGELPRWRALGVTLFLLQSDHAFLRAGAQRLAADVKAAAP